MSASSTSSRERRDAGLADAGPNPIGVIVLAWLVPGAAHAWLGQPRKAIVFFVVLCGMFVTGLALSGRLLPFQVADPLAFLAALAQWGLGVPRIVAAMAGAGQGTVTAVTYEYGNTFLIAGGLLNMLVALNASDLASARSRA
jgi:hypothetical protein